MKTQIPWRAIAAIMRLNKPIGTLLLLWPTLWALWLAAGGLPPWSITTIFILGVFITRSAGCVINDLWDRELDGHVERTAERPLASGAMRPRQAFILLALLAVIALGLALCLNALSIKLAFVGAALAAIYPACKRFLPIPQIILGFAFNWGIIMAFAAIQHHVPPLAWLLYVIANCWTIAYDTQYAMVDRNDDVKLGIHSSAITFASYDRLMVGLLQLSVIVGFVLMGQWLALTWPFYLAIGIAGLLFIYQQKLTWQRERQGCFQAFLNNAWVGAIIFIGLTL